jgi:hypothetical protein
LILGEGEINLLSAAALVGRSSTPRQHEGSNDRSPTITEANGMSAMERGGQHSKNESGDQPVPKAPKTPRATGLNALLETVRQKMAYTIRGI